MKLLVPWLAMYCLMACFMITVHFMTATTFSFPTACVWSFYSPVVQSLRRWTQIQFRTAKKSVSNYHSLILHYFKHLLSPFSKLYNHSTWILRLRTTKSGTHCVVLIKSGDTPGFDWKRGLFLANCHVCFALFNRHYAMLFTPTRVLLVSTHWYCMQP